MYYTICFCLLTDKKNPADKQRDLIHFSIIFLERKIEKHKTTTLRAF